MNITDQQKKILFHSLGLDDNGHGKVYRNYYCQPIDFESEGLKNIETLMAGGLMEGGRTINDGRDRYFYVTAAGVEVVKVMVNPLPKLTRSQKRYRHYLELDAGISFKEFLTTR